MGREMQVTTDNDEFSYVAAFVPARLARTLRALCDPAFPSAEVTKHSPSRVFSCQGDQKRLQIVT